MKRSIKGIFGVAMALTFASGLVFALAGRETKAAEEIKLSYEYSLSFTTGGYRTYEYDLHTGTGKSGYYLIEADGPYIDIDISLYYNNDDSPMASRSGTKIRFAEDIMGGRYYRIIVKGKARNSSYKEVKFTVTYIDPESPDVVEINEKSFPDEVFRKYVRENADIDGDFSLSEVEIGLIKNMRFKNDPEEPKDLTGIKYFKALKSFYYEDNVLKTLDVSGMDKLESLSVTWGSLKSIDCSGCSSLTTLELQANEQLTSLKFKGCNKIEYLNVNGDGLASLDLSALEDLSILMCGKMAKMKSIDLSRNIYLKELHIQDTSVTELNLSNNNSLVYIDVRGTEYINRSLSKIKLGYQPKLRELFCSQNSLTSLDVSLCPKLKHLSCADNQLESLDVSNNPDLIGLNCMNNLFKKLYKTASLNDIMADDDVTFVVLTASDWKFVDFTWNIDKTDPSKTVVFANYKCTKTGNTGYKTSQLMILKILLLEPKCEETGITEFLANLPATVSRTGESLSDKKSYETPATGHKWAGEKVTKKASAGVAGVKTHTCSVCKKKETFNHEALVICGKNVTLSETFKGESSVTWKSSNSKIATVDSKGKITAKMAGTVTITATKAGKSFKCTVTVLYKDVISSSDFWYEPTNYLTAKGVVKGYANQTEFRPSNDCTRAQMVTFLYRLQGEPKTKSNKCKFDDVKSTDYFYKPVIWAVEKGITTGVSKTSFNPQGVCTRAQTVTFLWRMAGKPEPGKNAKNFSDVKKTDYFYKATLWASDKKILAGYDDGTFRPQGQCLRRQMVTFLYKYDKYVNGKG